MNQSPPDRLPMTSEQRLAWLLERQHGIGSSDAPNILGIGFEDALEVYYDKTRPPPAEPPARGPLARGMAIEPLVAQMYTRVMGVDLITGPYMVRHSEARDWQFCNPDRLRLDNGGIVELKAVAGFGEQWGPSGTDLVPDVYTVQCQHQMGVCRRDTIDLAALDVIGWELRVYRIPFSAEFYEWLTEVENRFVLEHLRPRRPPGMAWMNQFKPEVERRLVRVGTTAEFGPIIESACLRREQLSQIIREAEAEKAAVTDEIARAMGSTERALAGQFKIKWVKRKAYTVPAREQPETVYLDVRRAKQRNDDETA